MMNEKNVILLCEDEETLRSVYAAGSLEWILNHTGCENEVYTKKNILDKPDSWTAVKYIFSTWGMPSFTETEIQNCFPNLEAVFYAAGSVQAFARPFLNCGVKVFSAWAANAVPVAEYVTAQILLANKGFFRTCQIGKQEDYHNARMMFHAYPGNYGAGVGIIGAGMVGKLVIRMLKNYNLRILVFDPFLPDETAEELGAEKASLSVIFSECQVISNHVANNEQTKGMFDYSLFASMRPASVFINTGRGAQVVEEDLVRVLQERPDLTAILDVTYPEPPEDGHPFYQLENCILTPHIAGSSGDEVHRMAAYMLEEYKRCDAKLPCLYEVNMKMLETMA